MILFHVIFICHCNYKHTYKYMNYWKQMFAIKDAHGWHWGFNLAVEMAI